VFAQNDTDRIPAKFLFNLGGINHESGLLRPVQIRFDSRNQEFYIADTGNDRIVILNKDGQQVFDFPVSPALHSPIDVAVDSNGRIYVLGSSLEGKPVQVFDYNGRYLRPFEFQGSPGERPSDLKNIVIDSDNHLFVLDEEGKRILSFSVNGDFRYEFPILEQLDKKLREEEVLGNLSLYGDTFYIPASSIGSIYCYSKKGSFVRMLGNKGGAFGELSFPISVSEDAVRNIFVLDKHRHTVICYDRTGKVIGEFGGRGISDGWFYYPISMIIDSMNRIWVAQVFQNSVQAFSLPEPSYYLAEKK
jgi:sugar lactone lactonase YvrE